MEERMKRSKRLLVLFAVLVFHVTPPAVACGGPTPDPAAVPPQVRMLVP